MKTVQDDTGKRYLLLKQAEQASLVRDPDSGNECYVQNDRLEPLDESPLETAARTVSSPVRSLLTSVHDEATLGLLCELETRGPLAIRTVLSAYDFCESDLNGRLAVLAAADLIEETEIGGERGYELTETGKAALETIRPTDEGTIQSDRRTGSPESDS